MNDEFVHYEILYSYMLGGPQKPVLVTKRLWYAKLRLLLYLIKMDNNYSLVRKMRRTRRPNVHDDFYYDFIEKK